MVVNHTETTEAEFQAAADAARVEANEALYGATSYWADARGEGFESQHGPMCACPTCDPEPEPEGEAHAYGEYCECSTCQHDEIEQRAIDALVVHLNGVIIGEVLS